MDTFPPGFVGPLSLIYGTSGRAAHLTVKIEALPGETAFYGPGGAGIAEHGTGVYDIDQFAYPTTRGIYRSSWYDDAVEIPGAVDYFQIGYTAFVAGVPSGSDLTTVGQAKNWLGVTDTTQDSRLQQLITAASIAVMEYAQREFAPVTTSATRTFALKRDGLITFANGDLQSITSMQIDTEPGGSPTTLTQDQYQLWPVDAPHGVYRGVKFYTFSVGPVLRQWFGLNRYVSVTGTWGFPSVPADVEQATLITVAKWFKRDETAWSNELPYPNTSTGNELPLDAIRLVQSYKRFV